MSHTHKTKDEDLPPDYSSVPQERSDSPGPSHVTLKSGCSMHHPIAFKRAEPQTNLSSVPQERSDSPGASHVTMKSDCSMHHPIAFKDAEPQTNPSSVPQERSDSPGPSHMAIKSDCSMHHPIAFKRAEPQTNLRKNPPPSPNTAEPASKKMKYEKSLSQAHNNKRMYSGGSHDIIKTFRLNLMKSFECLYEGMAKQGKSKLLSEIYTDLYITESESGEISREHELRQIETQSRRAETEDTPIRCSDIFTPLPGQDKAIRTVLTKGVAGIGKTVSVQKFILDWAEGKENQDVQLIFPIPFREINLMKDKTLSLSDLLHAFFPETKEMKISSDEYKMMFIFDGLDECRFSLNFHTHMTIRDVTKEASVDELLTNLIVGNLLPSALIWITSRPAAADLVPSKCVHRVTEVRGFTDPQKEEYFRKRISDQSLADRIISHLKSSRSLYIMCHIPVFCWISASVLEKMLSQADTEEIPKTLTQMYTHFLILQTNIKHAKDYKMNLSDEDMILKLGKLAFQQLVKGNIIFYEEDLRECGIDVTEASVYSGLCTQIFREEFGLNQMKVFCFVHLSVQEHLAALYVHLSYRNNSSQLFSTELSNLSMFFKYTLSDVHQRAVDEALLSKNGHLDLFLQFLLGLSVESNKILLQGLMTQTSSSSDSNERTVGYIKKMIKAIDSPEKTMNLFHCLNELGDHSLVEEIQQYLRTGTPHKSKLSCSQWSALVFVLLTLEHDIDAFDLNSFIERGNSSDEVLLKLLPVVKELRSAKLKYCGLTDEGCVALASALKVNPSHLREMDLSQNELKDSGVKFLCEGLKDTHCKLEILWLRKCCVTAEGCAALASALRSNPAHLRELDLSWNTLGDSAVRKLLSGLENSNCKLEILRLSDCGLTDVGCTALASALRSNPSHLRELDLSENKLQDSGIDFLSAGLKDPNCKLNLLKLCNCAVTAKGCAALASALRSNPEHLRYLNLSINDLRDYGVTCLCAGLEDAHCKLKILKLSRCEITDEGCAALTSALRSNPKHLRELHLFANSIGDSGKKKLGDLKDDPSFKLEIKM